MVCAVYLNRASASHHLVSCGSRRLEYDMRGITAVAALLRCSLSCEYPKGVYSTFSSFQSAQLYLSAAAETSGSQMNLRSLRCLGPVETSMINLKGPGFISM